MGQNQLGINTMSMIASLKPARSARSESRADLTFCRSDSRVIDSRPYPPNTASVFSFEDQNCNQILTLIVETSARFVLHSGHPTFSSPLDHRSRRPGRWSACQNASDLRETDALLEAADKAGTRLAVAENHQLMAETAEARRLIEAGFMDSDRQSAE